MKERPILMSHENVKAILEDRKDKTRRTSELQVINQDPDNWECSLLDNAVLACRNKITYTGGFYWGDWHHIKCPYGQVGDRLWVRERHHITCVGLNGGTEYRCYYSDGQYSGIPAKLAQTIKNQASNRPSIFMPRWASRITLEITGIRVERLQEITPQDSVREGAIDSVFAIHQPKWMAIDFFERLWNSHNPKYPWESNPWVWVVNFKKM